MAAPALGRRVFAPEQPGSYETVGIANLQKLQATANGFVYYDGSTVSSIDSAETSCGPIAWARTLIFPQRTTAWPHGRAIPSP